MEISKLLEPFVIPFEAEINGFLVHGLFDKNKIKGRHFIGSDDDVVIRTILLLSECVESWDLTEDDEPYEISVQSIAELPFHITNSILKGINSADKGEPPKCMS